MCSMKKTTRYLLIFLVLALFIRLLFIFHPGFLADIAYWKWWSSSPAEKGLVYTINYVNYNYPSFYLYILKLTGHIYLLFAPTNSPDFWNTYNPLFLFLIKLPYIFADLGIGILIFLFVKTLLPKTLNPKFTLRYSLLAPLLYLFNPVVIYNSAIWGQTDSLGTFFALLAMYMAVKGKISLSGVLLSLAFFLKVQTNIFLITTFLYIFIRFGISNTIKAVAVTTVFSLVLNTPYLISHTFDKVIETILTSFNYFPYISLNAYNLPWFLSPAGRPDQILDTTILFGNITFKTFGLVLFAAVLLLSLINILRVKHSEISTLGYELINSSALAIFAFYMLPTQMHERYIFPIFAFLPILIFANLKSLTNKITFFVISFTILLNLHLVMLLNYPDTTNLPFLPQNYDASLAHNLSLINIIIFIIFVFPFLLSLSKKILIPLLALPILIISLIALIPKDRGNIIYLSNLRPLKSSQGYGSLQKDRSIGGGRLSSSWIFYEKGLGTHANSEIVYSLDKKYKSFSTDFGIDTETPEPATVEFKILVDEKEKFKSGTIKKWGGPKSIKLDVADAQKLTLIVSDAGDGISNDHADWLNPKLLK